MNKEKGKRGLPPEVAIKVGHEIVVKTLPKDPIKVLQMQGRKLEKFSRAELRKMIEEEAMKEVG